MEFNALDSRRKYNGTFNEWTQKYNIVKINILIICLGKIFINIELKDFQITESNGILLAAQNCLKPKPLSVNL